MKAIWHLLGGTHLIIIASLQLVTRLSVDWITLRVHDVEKNLAVIFFIVTTSILVSK